MEYVKLRNNNTIPTVGLGTWQITDRDQMIDVISNAYDEGYRLIDTAAAYSVVRHIK
ncbi:aldo/keto reductase [Butyrivibrio sp. AC2005]|uniref:aldo/keto reductase n=1 Tax=Butyrivibrio sp. AC2005 TaxID=1280672 RepID=UPI0003F6F29E